MNVSPTWTTPKESGRHIAAPINECDCNVPALGYIQIEKMRYNHTVHNALFDDKPGTHHVKIGLLQSHNLKRRNRCIYVRICHGGGHSDPRLHRSKLPMRSLRSGNACYTVFSVMSSSVAKKCWCATVSYARYSYVLHVFHMYHPEHRYEPVSILGLHTYISYDMNMNTICTSEALARESTSVGHR